MDKKPLNNLDKKPLADRVRCGGRRLPRYAWYMLSGAICDVLQFLIDRVVYTSALVAMLPYERDTVSWTVAYVLTIAMRHETHRIFVFGAYEGSYWRNLGKMYMTYATTIAASIVLRSMLARAAEYLPPILLAYASARTYGYFATMLFTGIFSYFALKRAWGSSGGTSGGGAGGAGAADSTGGGNSARAQRSKRVEV